MIVYAHREDPRQLTEKVRESFLANSPCTTRINAPPGLLEATQLIAINVTEAFVDERHEQTDKDVHAENVPRNEEKPCPRLATTVAPEKVLSVDT